MFNGMVKKILKMSASWCFPCKMYAKTFEEVSKQDKYKDIAFEEIDIEENEDFTGKYLIRSVPTTVFLDENEQVLLKLNGNLPKSELENAINDLKEDKND